MSETFEDVIKQAEKEMGGGKYLTLKNKGDKIVVRIASEPPVCINKHWMIGADGKNTAVNCTGEACVYCGENVPTPDKIKKTPLFAWVILDRNDGDTPKMYKAPYQVAKTLYELSLDKEYGSPINWDVTITRTEDPGSGYYRVIPRAVAAESKPITDEEKEAIKKANFDLKAELGGGRNSEHLGNYGAKAEELETTSKTEKKEPVETDDIPF